MAEKKETVWHALEEAFSECASRTSKILANEWKKEHKITNAAEKMDAAADWIIQEYSKKNYLVQKIRFEDAGKIGILIQIRAAGKGMEYAWKSIGGQQCAACARFLPSENNALILSVSDGKWLDKVVSGILSWAIFFPLIVVPAIGAWKQKKFLDRIEQELLLWFASHAENNDQEARDATVVLSQSSTAFQTQKEPYEKS